MVLRLHGDVRDDFLCGPDGEQARGLADWTARRRGTNLVDLMVEMFRRRQTAFRDRTDLIDVPGSLAPGALRGDRPLIREHDPLKVSEDSAGRKTAAGRSARCPSSAAYDAPRRNARRTSCGCDRPNARASNPPGAGPLNLSCACSSSWTRNARKRNTRVLMERGKCAMVRTATGKSAPLVEMKTSLKRCGTAACSNALETSRACFRSLLGKRPRARPRISGGKSRLGCPPSEVL